jgi:hypothetical protein
MLLKRNWIYNLLKPHLEKNEILYMQSNHYQKGKVGVLAASSVVTREVLPFLFVGGLAAKPIARVTVSMTLDTHYEDFKEGLMPL